MVVFPRLMLSKEVTRSEIFNTVKHMNPLKAPGCDGLQAAFIQSQWQFVGESFCRLVLEIMRNPKKVETINETF